jgi:uncharacterized membrane protein
MNRAKVPDAPGAEDARSGRPMIAPRSSRPPSLRLSSNAARFRWPRTIRVIRGHLRFFSGLITSLGVAYFLPDTFAGTTKLLIAWSAGVWTYFALSAIIVARATPQSLKYNAKATDEGKFLILVLTMLAAAASIGAITAHLAAAPELHGIAKVFHVGLAATTIVTSWLLIHLVFAFHYAHEYYDEFETTPGKPADLRGGLVFSETHNPDYYDFLYFSYIVGTSAQTADVAISSRAMRRTVLVHSILAFLFNSAVLALTINLVAGLI